MIPNERGRLFKTLRRLHGHNVDSGLNDLTEAFASFMTRARFFSIGHLRRTWSHSAVEFMKYRRRLPQLIAGDDDDDVLNKFGGGNHDGESSADVTHGSKRIYVSNVPSKVTTAQLASFFSKFGKVSSCSVPVDRSTSTIPRRSKGCAFVTFRTFEDAEKALIASPKDLMLYDKTMVVSLAIRPTKKRHSDHWGTKLGDDLSRSVTLASGEDNESVYSETETDTEQTSTPSSPILSISSLNALPNRALLLMFTYLPLPDRVRMERVCKRWQELCFESWASTKSLSFRSLFLLFRNKPLQNPTLKSILHRCGPHLHMLDLSGAAQFLNDHSLAIVADTCRKLKHVNLTGVKVDWRALKLFAEFCGPQLETIIYRDAFSLNEKGFFWLFRFCTNLKTVDLGNCVRMSGQCFRLLGPSLENVCLDGCRKLTPSAVEELCLKCQNVKRLILDDCVLLNNSSLALISRSLPHLEAFSMKGGPFPALMSSGLCNLARLSHLSELHLDYNKSVDDTVLRAMTEGCAGKLCFLTLAQAGASESLTRVGLLELQACRKLNELDLSYLTATNDLVLERLSAANPNLNTVRVRGCVCLTDKGVESLVRNCLALQDLDLSGCVAVTNNSVQKFFDATRTTALTLTLGGSSCEAQKLFRRLNSLGTDRSSKIVLDTMDLCRAHVRRSTPGIDIQSGSGGAASSSEVILDTDDEDLNDDEFESLTTHRSFVLDELEEDDILPVDENPLDNEYMV